jgi:hypothetical protein
LGLALARGVHSPSSAKVQCIAGGSDGAVYRSKVGGTSNCDSRSEIKSFQIGHQAEFLGPGRLTVLRDGAVLVSKWHGNRVSKFDQSGKSVWHATVRTPVGLVLLPNEHCLVGSLKDKCVVELDRNGKEVNRNQSPWRGHDCQSMNCSRIGFLISFPPRHPRGSSVLPPLPPRRPPCSRTPPGPSMSRELTRRELATVLADAGRGLAGGGF